MFNGSNVNKDLGEFWEFCIVRCAFKKILLFKVKLHFAKVVVEFLCKSRPMDQSGCNLPRT